MKQFFKSLLGHYTFSYALTVTNPIRPAPFNVLKIDSHELSKFFVKLTKKDYIPSQNIIAAFIKIRKKIGRGGQA